jgi:serine/threonine protein kinase
MICPRCATDNTSDSRFCKKCASPLPPPAEPLLSPTMTLPGRVEALAVGSLFAGRYQVLEELGKGGMGRVYKVLDTKIHETLALKLLDPIIAAGDGMIERFKNEMISARQISHRNVCRMYDLNEADGVPFITMEYVGGEDLKTTVRRVGPLGIGKAVLIASQVCEGLAEAHRLGIIHRDLKPQNIMLDKSGVAHIMDFGIARSSRRPGLTGPGDIIGTPEYMAPELVDGEQADLRADLYALGIVLFETVTGRVPFTGDSTLAIAFRQKNEAPPNPAELNPQIPEDLVRVILKCLEKKKERRYQSAEDLLVDLREIGERAAAAQSPVSKEKPLAPGPVPSRGKRRKLVPAVVAIATVAGVAAIIIFFPRAGSKAPLPPQFRQITFSGTAYLPAISPDGKFVAYAEPAGAASKVMVQDLSGGAPLEVFGDRRCDFLRWLPNGSELSLIARDTSSQKALLIIPRLGGTPRPVESRGALTLIAWSPDGSQYASPETTSISIITKTTGAAKTLLIKGPVAKILDLDWAPIGNRLAFTAINDQREYALRTIRIDGSEQEDVVAGPSFIESPRWSSKGDAVYFLQGTGQSMDLWKISVSPRTGRPSGPAEVILSELQARTSFSVTSDGRKLAYSRLMRSGHIWLAESPASGQDLTVKASPLTTGTSINDFPSISPDGKQMAFVMTTGKSAEIYVMPLDGGSARQLTFMNSMAYGPAWSPDGREIAFISMEGGAGRVWKVLSGGGAPVPFNAEGVGGYYLAWDPGGRILYQTMGNRNIGMIDPETGKVDYLIKESESGWPFKPRFSPDGGKIAFHWNQGSTRGIWTISQKTGERRALFPGYHLPAGWSSDGRWIYAALPRGQSLEIVAIDAEKGGSRTILIAPVDPEKGVPNAFSVSMTADGRRFVFDVGKSQADVWLAENFDPAIR